MNLIQKFLIFLFLLSVGLLISCEKSNEFNDQEIDFKTAFNNKIYAKKAGAQIQLDKAALAEMWKKELDIDKKVELKEFRIIKGKYADTGQDFYQLKTISEDGGTSISNALVMENGLITLGKNTCKCETNSCSWSGCDANQTSTRCTCSPCSGDCKKTSTSTDEIR